MHHVRPGAPTSQLERGSVVMHPFVVGEIACGSLTHRASILELLRNLPAAAVAESEEVLGFIERHTLHGKGIGHIDVHLLASVTLTHGARLWTRDKRLQARLRNSAARTRTPLRIEFGHRFATPSCHPHDILTPGYRDSKSPFVGQRSRPDAHCLREKG